MRNECTRNNLRLLPFLNTPPGEVLLVARFLADSVREAPDSGFDFVAYTVVLRAAEHQRHSFETEYPVASLSARCEAYRLAYIQEAQRNNHLVQHNIHLVQAYRTLSGQHGFVLHELSVLASQYCSLEKELFEAQTDAVAYEAVVQEYKLALASQSSLAAREASSSTELLTARIAELERERADMQRALVIASELVIASRKRSDWARPSGSEF
ncbi:hypothetical protein PMIN04_012730 [Paraphaeosphaeria minitans]|uniref:Uncharacterized protein n=1 Tax=Paraphaeosphaeria minitans TaxID=565426 RepID=A0A9P6G6U5_9PLEO|nr:hypothetical protein PMIN01_12105 [Paraphaeosphaeria minitans]